jgi:V-type H+-transporting ATPase subunit H
MLMSSSGVLNFTQQLITTKRFFGDDEVREDSEWLRDYLRSARKELTTWDEYTAEIDSKHLSWTPVHTDDDFWNENAQKLSDNGQAVLK